MKVNLQRMEAKQAAKAHARLQASEDRKAANMAGLVSGSRAITPGTYAGATAGAVPKTEAKRNPALLEMAQGRPCLLCPEGRCHCTPGSVVACHSNLGIHGKAGARKADDQYSVWGGDQAHFDLDRSGKDAGEKETAFMRAHMRQVQAWRVVATDASEPERFRKAARWALDQLGASPIGEME
jgi:hypothetical protein